MAMTVRARVKNGRLIVDEPTDLPEGTEIDLTAWDDEPWDLTSEQQRELSERIASGTAPVSAETLFTRLRPER